jgi:predicted ArsR family transcriptional regulator
MQETRWQILEILKKCGEVTVQELSQKLGLTSVTVRHHLEILRAEGYVTDPEIRHSNRPGRPRYIYKLADAAADLFPNNYRGLAEALLDAIHENVEPAMYHELLDKTAQCLAAGAGELPEDHDERMACVVAYLNEQGFIARWQKDEGTDATDAADYYIYISNCPYHYVAQQHAETCEIDERLIQLLTGGKLERLEGYASENDRCVYKITWPQQAGET